MLRALYLALPHVRHHSPAAHLGHVVIVETRVAQRYVHVEGGVLPVGQQQPLVCVCSKAGGVHKGYAGGFVTGRGVVECYCFCTIVPCHSQLCMLLSAIRMCLGVHKGQATKILYVLLLHTVSCTAHLLNEPAPSTTQGPSACMHVYTTPMHPPTRRLLVVPPLIVDRCQAHLILQTLRQVLVPLHERRLIAALVGDVEQDA